MEVRAQVTPRYATTLSSEIVGRIVSLPVREGESFVEGQELAAIDCASYEARLTQADAQTRRNERKAQALRLLDQRGATGKVELELAEIDVAASRAERQLAAIDVSRCTINAPFSGSVTGLKVKNHQYVPVGEQIISILSNRELEVEMLVPSRWLAWLTTGRHFTIHIDELDQDFPASVTRLAADIDPVSQSVKVFATVTGDFPSLSPGMSGLARFNVPEPEPAQ
ncbi:efflux RND transporter periplasmic adaptor subunit [Pseudochelatococcus contaminans]|uniref:RND family efflux transporter MFP subunit n=1 Tax=Pseudochelatococcus contaminans TaxID=1538103 RepID=A0A7W6EEC7_9HYPH|nr:efflux RND transporter periplasmic adaptor subunit [Pseudochelatococcus contaminans]MBB3808174.1 RND family efflux transporter MFP subunit [Pseudochelatococcus contaminans]